MQNASASPAQSSGNSPLPVSDKPIQELAEAQMPPKVLASHQASPQHTNTTKPFSSDSGPIETTTPTLPASPPASETRFTPPAPSTENISDTTGAGGSAGTPPGNSPPETPQEPVQNPVQKSKRKAAIIGGLAVLVLVVGGALSALFLTETGQDIRNQAAYYNQNVTSKGLKVPNSSEPGSSSASNYKPASSNPNESFYDQGKGETVSFSTNIKNESGGTVQDKYQLVAFKINRVDDREDGWMDVNENTAMGERRMYENHRDNGDCEPPDTACFKGTVQEKIYATGWKDFTIAAGETKSVTGTWKPGPNDCGMYQLDMQIESSGGDKIVAVGMIRVKNCAPVVEENVRIAGSVICYENAGGARYAITNATVNVANKDYSINNDGIYTTDTYKAGTTIAARLTLPAQLQLRNLATGETMTVPSAGLPTAAFNGCENSATPNFMQTNCGGINEQRAAQCKNAKSSPKGYPNSYEWCTLPGGSAQLNSFDFGVYGCVKAQPTPTPTPTPSPTATPTPPPSPTPTPTTPVGGMCVGLCGVTNANATPTTTDFAQCPAGGGAVGSTQIKIGDYLHFRCVYKNATNVKIILTDEDGKTVDLGAQYSAIDTSYKASYRVKKAGSVSARCEVSSATPVTPPAPSVSDDACQRVSGTCNLKTANAGGCSRLQTERTDISCGPATDGTARVCCVNNQQTQLPTPTPVATPVGSTGSCANGAGNCKQSCGGGESGTSGNGCSLGLLCCLPSANM